MKALTLHQPWASLIALGIKTIETRSWSTSYRGPLAIHAAKRTPEWRVMKELIADRHEVWARWFAAGLVSEDGSLDCIPLGAVVAVVDLVDVVPITIEPQARDARPVGDRRVAVDRNGVLRMWTSDEIGGYSGWVGVGDGFVTDQLPFGDFTPGRFAWLLDNIRPLAEPIPAKGRQGLWDVALCEVKK